MCTSLQCCHMCVKLQFHQRSSYCLILGDLIPCMAEPCPRNYNQCMADSQWKWSLPCMALNAWWHHFGSWSGACLLAWPVTYVSLMSVGLSIGTSPPIQQAARKLQTGCRHCVCCNRYLTYSTIVVKRCKHGCHSNIVLSRSDDVVFLIW